MNRHGACFALGVVASLVVGTSGCEDAAVADCQGRLVEAADHRYCVFRDSSARCSGGLTNRLEVGGSVVCSDIGASATELPPEVCAALEITPCGQPDAGSIADGSPPEADGGLPATSAVVTWTASCSLGCREQPLRTIDGFNGEDDIQLECSVLRGAGGTRVLTLSAHATASNPEFGLRIDGATWDSVGVQAGGAGCAVAITEQYQTYGPGTCIGGTPCRVLVTEESAGEGGSLNLGGTVICEELVGPDPSAPFRGVQNGSFQVTNCEFQ